MKKLLVVLLALALIFAFAACGQQEAPVEEEPAAEEEAISIGQLTLNGTTEEEISQWLMGKSGETVKHTFYDDLTSMLLALDKGDISYAIMNKAEVAYIMGINPEQYSCTDRGFINSCYSMAVMAENTALLETLNTALAALEADGTLAALQEQYIDNCDPANMPAPAPLPRFDGAETVKVVVTGDVPPMDYMTADGQAAGYNIALLSAIAEQAQINIELVSANAGSRAMMITSGKADAVFWCTGCDSDSENKDLPDELTETAAYLSIGNCWLGLAE